jgi:hypothetical protein
LISFGTQTQLQTTALIAIPVSILFTIIPFTLWYTGIKESGVQRVSITGFLEPLTTSFFSLFIIQDTKINSLVLGGFFISILGILSSLIGKNLKPSKKTNWINTFSHPRIFKSVGFQFIFIPLLYPILISGLYIQNEGTQKILEYYLNPINAATNLLGFLTLWGLWNYQKWSKLTMALYVLATGILFIRFVNKELPNLNPRDYFITECLLLLLKL